MEGHPIPEPRRLAYLKLWAPLLALVGLLAAAALAAGYGYVQGLGGSYWRLDDAWCQAGFLFVGLALLVLGAGHFMAGWPELLRMGPVAKRFSRAELLDLQARHRIPRRIFWALLMAGGLGTCAFVLMLWEDNSGRWSYNYGGRYAENACVIAAFVSFSLSILVPMVMAAGAAVHLSSARRSGGAANLLMAPLTADYLGWAMVQAYVRRGVWLLVASAPYYALTLLLFAEEWRRHTYLENIWVMAILLPFVVLVELLMIRRAVSVGVWLGASLPSPAPAAAVAALAAVMMWLLRLVVVLISMGIAMEFFRRSWARFWMWPALSLAWEWVFLVVIAPPCMWLARGSLRAPFGLRLGAWMIRTGERLSGLAGEGVLAEVEAGLAERTAGSRGGAVRWKGNMVGLWLASFLLFIAFPLTGAIAQGVRSTESSGWIFGICFLVILFVGLGVKGVAYLIGRRIRSGDELGAGP